MNRFVAVFGVIALIGGCACTRNFQYEIRQEITIAAPPSEVWQVLSATTQYSLWNPVFTQVSGRLEPGQTLVVVNRSVDGKAMTFRPVVQQVHPGRELRWLGRLWAPGFFDGEHYFMLSQTADGGTNVRQGEIFTGVLVPFTKNWLRDTVSANFEAMNRALQLRVEHE